MCSVFVFLCVSASGLATSGPDATQEFLLSGKRRHVMDASLDVEYTSISDREHSALVTKQRKSIAEEAKTMTVNDGLSGIDAVFMPSVHRMVNSAYSIIDTELRRLLREAHRGSGGLDKSGTAQFERYASSLVRLVNLERSVRDDSEVEAMSDEELTKKVIEKLSPGDG